MVTLKIWDEVSSTWKTIPNIAGPNEITNDTDCAVSGLLKGASDKVAQATSGTDYLAPTTSGDARRVYGVSAANAQELTEIESTPVDDSVKLVTSGGIYDALAGKAALLNPVFRLTGDKTLAAADCGYTFFPNASSHYTITIPKDTLSEGFNFAVLIDNAYNILTDPAADVSLNGAMDTLTFTGRGKSAYFIMTATNTCEAIGDV